MSEKIPTIPDALSTVAQMLARCPQEMAILQDFVIQELQQADPYIKSNKKDKEDVKPPELDFQKIYSKALASERCKKALEKIQATHAEGTVSTQLWQAVGWGLSLGGVIVGAYCIYYVYRDQYPFRPGAPDGGTP